VARHIFQACPGQKKSDHNVRTNEDPSLRMESFVINNIRGVFHNEDRHSLRSLYIERKSDVSIFYL
jgi:hypothetical protein